MPLTPVMNLDDFRAEAAVKMVALGDLIDEYGGLIQTGPFGSQLHQRDYTEHGVPVVMPKDIRAGRIDESTVARVSEHKATELARHYLKPGSIVFPRRGEIGKCAHVDGYTERFLCGTGCMKIEPPAEILEPQFVYYYLYRRRPDLIGFVNGLPLLFIECKNMHRDLKAAFEANYSDYRDTVPHLFHHNAVVMFANGEQAKIGSITSRWEHFHEWKRLAEEEPGAVAMETLLKGVCDRRNFIDLVENFILFDDSSGALRKIVARNHQFLGVNRAVQAVRERRSRQGRLGVFWHTQGAGKSYSMVMFTRKVRRKLGGNFTFLVLTDRDDLDRQIYRTFAGCGVVDHDREPCRAASGAHLSRLLAERTSHVFSLIQKFNQDAAPGAGYTGRDDLIVITDEAHRTQYGNLALNLRRALPNASYLGFTGTPLFTDDQLTRRVFGDYVSTYDFQRAVEDGATHPFRVAIVCAMWLTGFDVPSLATLYLDKPLKAHTLMQAIARANRVNDGKNNGLIVDYCGILKHLRSALATFAGTLPGAGAGGGRLDPARPEAELLDDLDSAIALVRGFLRGGGAPLDAVLRAEGFARNAAIVACKEAANESDETRKRFEVMCREVFKKFRACITVPGVAARRADRDAIDIIYRSLQQDRERADVSGIMRSLHEVVDDAIEVRSDRVAEAPEPFDVSRIDFDLLRQEFRRGRGKRTAIQELKHLVETRLRRLLERNPLRTDFQEHYEGVVAAYNREKGRLTIERTFETLLKLEQELDEEERRAVREGLDEESLAVFDLLKKPDLKARDIKRIKDVAVGLLQTLKAEKLRVDRWQEKEATRAAVRVTIKDFLWSDRTGLPDDYTDPEVDARSEAVFRHVFRVYPTVPSPYYRTDAA